MSRIWHMWHGKLEKILSMQKRNWPLQKTVVLKIGLDKTAFFFKKMGQPRPLFHFYVCLFKHTLQFLHKINVKKCPSGTQCQDSNSQPLEHESPSITTRPGLTPQIKLHSFY